LGEKKTKNAEKKSSDQLGLAEAGLPARRKEEKRAGRKKSVLAGPHRKALACGTGKRPSAASSIPTSRKKGEEEAGGKKGKANPSKPTTAKKKKAPLALAKGRGRRFVVRRTRHRVRTRKKKLAKSPYSRKKKMISHAGPCSKKETQGTLGVRPAEKKGKKRRCDKQRGRKKPQHRRRERKKKRKSYMRCRTSSGEISRQRRTEGEK